MKFFLALIAMIALLLATPAFAGSCAAGGCGDPGGMACELCPAAAFGVGCGPVCATPPVAPAVDLQQIPGEGTADFAAFTARFSDSARRPEAPPPR